MPGFSGDVSFEIPDSAVFGWSGHSITANTGDGTGAATRDCIHVGSTEENPREFQGTGPNGEVTTDDITTGYDYDPINIDDAALPAIGKFTPVEFEGGGWEPIDWSAEPPYTIQPDLDNGYVEWQPNMPPFDFDDSTGPDLPGDFPGYEGGDDQAVTLPDLDTGELPGFDGGSGVGDRPDGTVPGEGGRWTPGVPSTDEGRGRVIARRKIWIERRDEASIAKFGKREGEPLDDNGGQSIEAAKVRADAYLARKAWPKYSVSLATTRFGHEAETVCDVYLTDPPLQRRMFVKSVTRTTDGTECEAQIELADQDIPVDAGNKRAWPDDGDSDPINELAHRLKRLEKRDMNPSAPIGRVADRVGLIGQDPIASADTADWNGSFTVRNVGQTTPLNALIYGP